MKISIVIPTYNEAQHIEKLVHHLLKYKGDTAIEIVVADGGSYDETFYNAKQAGASAVLSTEKGRAVQMNYGASIATGDVLYFVHADSFPPASFAQDILQAVSCGYDLGRYQTKFNSKSIILKANAFFTRFDLFMCYGGDQTLFITKKLFTTLNGFNSNMRIMEEYDLVARARQQARYKIFSAKTLISARKYETNSWWQVQKANYTIIQMFKRGVSQNEMVDTYKKMLRYR